MPGATAGKSIHMLSSKLSLSKSPSVGECSMMEPVILCPTASRPMIMNAHFEQKFDSYLKYLLSLNLSFTDCVFWLRTEPIICLYLFISLAGVAGASCFARSP